MPNSSTTTNWWSDSIWTKWTSDTWDNTTTAANSTLRFWTNWAGTTGAAITGSSNAGVVWSQWARSPEEERRAAQVDQRHRLSQRRTQRVIRKTAEDLLRQVVGPKLYEEWRRYRAIRVEGSHGGLFEINPSWLGMVYELDRETLKPKRKMCVHPCESFPVEDRVAALFLHLKHDEPGVVRQANLHRFGRHEEDRVMKRRPGGERPVAFIGRAEAVLN